MVLVKAEDIGMTGTELPEEVNSNKEVSDLLEKIRGVACCKMGFAKNLKDATENSPAVPKVGFVTVPKSYTDIAGQQVSAEDMDVCARVISVFKCHKACPLTSASAISVAAAHGGLRGRKSASESRKDWQCPDWPPEWYYDHGSGAERREWGTEASERRRSENRAPDHGWNPVYPEVRYGDKSRRMRKW